MKSRLQTFALALLAAVLTLSEVSCATFNPDTPTVDEAADCAKEAGKQAFYDLLPRVNTVLASGGNPAVIAEQLAVMVGKFGINTIACLVAHVGNNAAQDAETATGDERALHQLRRDNAARWLQDNGFEEFAPPSPGGGSGG